MTLSLVAVVAVLALHCPATQARVVHGGASAAAAQESSHSALPFHVLRRPGYLGVSLRDLDAAEATRLHRRGAMGAMIITVDRDAPAWAAGLRPEDVILELNGQGVDGVEALRHRLRDFQPGDTITLRVRRRDDEMTYSVLLGDQDKVAQSALTRHLHTPPGSTLLADTPLSSDATNPSPPMSLMSPAPTRGITSTLFDALIPGSTYTGLEVDPLTPQLAEFFGVHTRGGLLVTVVNAGSPAANAGLAAGDVIVRASNRPVNSRSALAHAIRIGKGDAIPLAVLRDHREFILTLLPEKRKKF